ncbi:hypothetical protein [Neosynechococcus sphagnicola]|uniref:hypothetical protein n=1 Tax=Neosynechococcus sphagnicola TaxID=1501145 RepID=UPI000566E9FB|nr:hypothetical protein [Neosynechococcus sphagnicola]
MAAILAPLHPTREVRNMTQATDTEIRDLILGLDKKIDGLDKKLDIFIAQSTEQFKGVNQRLDTIEKRIESQDGRVWGILLVTLSAALAVAGKLAFFPNGPA